MYVLMYQAWTCGSLATSGPQPTAIVQEAVPNTLLSTTTWDTGLFTMPLASSEWAGLSGQPDLGAGFGLPSANDLLPIYAFNDRVMAPMPIHPGDNCSNMPIHVWSPGRE